MQRHFYSSLLLLLRRYDEERGGGEREKERAARSFSLTPFFALKEDERPAEDQNAYDLTAAGWLAGLPAAREKKLFQLQIRRGG